MAGKGRRTAAVVAAPYNERPSDRSRGGSQATRIVGLTDELELWHTPDHVPFVTIPVAEHLEHWPIKSTTFRRWLSHVFYRVEAAAPNSTALASAREVIEGKALHEGKKHLAFTRVAGVENFPLIYLDLCDDSWRAVEISLSGWRTLASHDVPIWFRRSGGMAALPQPEHGGSIDELRDFLNVASDGDFALCVSWAVAALRHQGPYPILCLHGEQGAAKTTVARMLRALIDPNAAPVRAEPRDPRDLAISARNGWIIAMDNLSSIRPWLSDALCRLSTGGGWVTRALYTDSEEIIFDAQRPILITGISEVATRGDLLDRSILLTLPAIPEESRAAESLLWARFNEVSPRLLGALLDGVVSALRHERDVSLRQTPRMADFARWSVAAEKVYPWPDGTFLRAYRLNRRDSHEISLEASAVASEVRRLLESVDGWTGTAQELLDTLEERAPGETSHLRAWPKSPRSLSAKLRRLAPNLRAVGVEVEFDQTSGGGSKRLIVLKSRGDSCDASDASGDAHRPDSQSGDGGVASVANPGPIQSTNLRIP